MERGITLFGEDLELEFRWICTLTVAFLATKFINRENPYFSIRWTVFQSTFFVLYNVLFTGLRGQTIGKILLGIKVLDISGKRSIGIKRAFIRDAFPIILEVIGLLILGLQICGQATSDSIGPLAEMLLIMPGPGGL